MCIRARPFRTPSVEQKEAEDHKLSCSKNVYQWTASKTNFPNMLLSSVVFIMEQELEDRISQKKFIPLPDNFLLGKTDVVCGKGNAYCNLPGNILYTKIIRQNLQSYVNTKKRKERSLIIEEVLGEIFSQGCRFVKKDRRTNKWFELSRKQAHQKVGHALRDMPRCKQGPFDVTNEIPPSILVASTDMNSNVLGPVKSEIPGWQYEISLPVDTTEWDIYQQNSEETRDDDWSECDLDSIDYLVASQLLSDGD
jgi:hypothetical protein